MPTVANVTTGKPRVGGAIFRAPVGTTLPTTADATLVEAFKELGYVSEDGVTNSNSPESEKIKAWGGQIVLIVATEREDTFQFSLIETMNAEVAKMVYGSENVEAITDTSGTIGHKISVNADQPETASYVIDMKLRNGALKRIVIPEGQLSKLGDIVYDDEEVVAYEVTIDALPDDSGNNHYEYIKYAAEG